MENFEFLTETEKNSAAYKACVAAPAGVGFAYGSFAGGALGAGIGSAPAALLGGLVGFAIGLVTCPRLKDPIKKKLFSATPPLSDRELMTAMQAVQSMHSGITKSDAIELLAQMRNDAAMNPRKYGFV